MDFSNRGNRPAAQQQQQHGQQAQPVATAAGTSTEKKKMKMPMAGSSLQKAGAIFMLFGIAILAGAMVIALVFGGNNSVNQESDAIKTEQYQAVFLDSPDGQVYFGKLDVLNREKYVLTDIYYVRVEQPIQPQGQETASQPNISLAKLGNELHGPEDVMFISRDKVLYWENLKDDGQVVTAITEFKASGGESTGNATPAANQQGAAPAAGTQLEGTPQQNDTPATGSEETPDTTDQP